MGKGCLLLLLHDLSGWWYGPPVVDWWCPCLHSLTLRWSSSAWPALGGPIQPAKAHRGYGTRALQWKQNSMNKLTNAKDKMHTFPYDCQCFCLMKLIFFLVSIASKTGYFRLSVSTSRGGTAVNQNSFLTLYMVCPAPSAEMTIEWQEPFHTCCMETKDFLVYSLRFLV